MNHVKCLILEQAERNPRESACGNVRVMDVFLNTEIAARELDANILTALVAAARGHRVFIFDQRDLPLLSKYAFGESGVFHTKSLHGEEGMTRIHRSLKEKKLALTSLDQEAGLLQSDYGQFARTRFSRENLDLADKIFCWGPRDFEFLTSQFPHVSKKFVTTGSSRVDLWDPKFSSVSNYVRNSQPYILFSSNFTANTFYRHWEIHAGMAAGWPDDFDDLEDDYFGELSDSFRLQGFYLKLFRQLSQTFPKLKIVVRPHPTEDRDAWRTFFADLPNVSVRSEGSLISWIHGASAVIQTGCTAALEATVAGRPAITFIPFDLSTSWTDFALSFGQRESSVSGVVELVREIIDRSVASEKRIEADRKRLANRVRLDSLAAERIVGEWEELASGKKSSTRPLFVWTLVGAISRLSWWARRAYGDGPRGAFSLDKFPRIDIRQVKTRAGKFAKVVGVGNRYRIRKLYSRGLVVEPLWAR